MPKWIHDRARHIQAKNPGMNESTAFAVATQQAHKLKKTPKGYGTPEGRKAAKSKYLEPKKSYTQSADPKGIGKKLDAKLKKEAMTADPTYDLVILQSLRDEVTKIAMSAKEAGKAVDLAKAFGTAFKGSKLTKPVTKDVATTAVEKPGLLGRAFGKKPKEVVTGTKSIEVGREKVPLVQALKDPSLRTDALKTIGARGATAGAALGGGVEYSKHQKRKSQQRMGKAYISGARDMYSRLHGYR